jgi:hypothetical protein
MLRFSHRIVDLWTFADQQALSVLQAELQAS